MWWNWWNYDYHEAGLRGKNDDDGDNFLCLRAELNVHLIFQGSYTSSLFWIAQGDLGLLKETYHSCHDDDDDDDNIYAYYEDDTNGDIKSFTEKRFSLTVMI